MNSFFNCVAIFSFNSKPKSSIEPPLDLKNPLIVSSTKSISTSPFSFMSPLTRQEQVVLDEVSKLQIEKEIGDGLCISPDTVNTHINNMKKKIKDVNGLSPRTKQELIAYKISTITGKAFDLKKVREYGIQVLLIMINVCSLIHKRFNSSFKLFSHIFTCVRRYLLFFMPSVVFFKEYMIDA